MYSTTCQNVVRLVVQQIHHKLMKWSLGPPTLRQKRADRYTVKL